MLADNVSQRHGIVGKLADTLVELFEAHRIFQLRPAEGRPEIVLIEPFESRIVHRSRMLGESCVSPTPDTPAPGRGGGSDMVYGRLGTAHATRTGERICLATDAASDPPTRFIRGGVAVGIKWSGSTDAALRSYGSANCLVASACAMPRRVCARREPGRGTR